MLCLHDTELPNLEICAHVDIKSLRNKLVTNWSSNDSTYSKDGIHQKNIFFFQFVKYLKTAKIRKRKNREERQNPGRFFHFAPPDRLGWLHYWHSEKNLTLNFLHLFISTFSQRNLADEMRAIFGKKSCRRDVTQFVGSLWSNVLPTVTHKHTLTSTVHKLMWAKKQRENIFTHRPQNFLISSNQVQNKSNISLGQ